MHLIHFEDWSYRDVAINTVRRQKGSRRQIWSFAKPIVEVALLLLIFVFLGAAVLVVVGAGTG